MTGNGGVASGELVFFYAPFVLWRGVDLVLLVHARLPIGAYHELVCNLTW